MKATILITGERKENYLIETINSCLNQDFNNYEIILLFSELKNLNILKKKFRGKIFFKRIIKRKKNPVKDQLYKISVGTRIAKGEFIFLLDGDDLFKKNKLKKILKHKKKGKLYLDDHILLKKRQLIYKESNNFKNNKLYKLILNSWPDKVCTSCISAEKKLFEVFFKNVNINKYNFLAIDILIVIFNLKNVTKIKKILTIKKVLDSSVDTHYSNFLKQIYWERRIEQHKFLKEVQSINYSLEFYLSKFISNLFYFRKHIRKIF